MGLQSDDQISNCMDPDSYIVVLLWSAGGHDGNNSVGPVGVGSEVLTVLQMVIHLWSTGGHDGDSGVGVGCEGMSGTNRRVGGDTFTVCGWT